VAPRGLRIIDVRDEGAAVHMAAHAELTGMLGVAMATAGPGVTNTVTAMANASLARAPVRRVFWLRVNLIDPPLNERMERFRGQRPRPADVVSCLRGAGTRRRAVTVSI
jgi:hypothetical protein